MGKPVESLAVPEPEDLRLDYEAVDDDDEDTSAEEPFLPPS